MWYLKRKSLLTKHVYNEHLILYFKLLKFGIFGYTSYSYSNKVIWKSMQSSVKSVIGWSSLGYKFNRHSTSAPSRLQRPNYVSNLPQQSYTGPLHFSSRDFLLRAFLVSWGMSRPKSNMRYVTHSDFRVLFLSANIASNDLGLVNAKKYFSRWIDSYNLLFNLFYSAPSAQMLANKSFIEEVLVFNWQNSFKNYKFFKHVQPWFVFGDSMHGSYLHSTLTYFIEQNLDFLIVLDIDNHVKVLPYLKSYNLYIVGLIPASRSPWQVSYPIPTFAGSSISQFYFVRWTFFIRGRARSAKYCSNFDLWLRSTS